MQHFGWLEKLLNEFQRFLNKAIWSVIPRAHIPVLLLIDNYNQSRLINFSHNSAVKMNETWCVFGSDNTAAFFNTMLLKC